MPEKIRIGTRSSELALWQANHIADLLREHYPNIQIEIVTFTTKGDKIIDKSLPSIGGKGVFTEELEKALLNGDIDCAVHSLKDLPTENPKGLTIGAVPKRGSIEDVLVSKHRKTLDELPEGAKIGTSSLRRAAQLRAYRADLEIIDIRGNVPTRIKKALDPDGDYDAIVLAHAGVERLDLGECIIEIIPLHIMLPAPGQGAIGVQCRVDFDSLNSLSKISDSNTAYTTLAEREFLRRLDGGCSVPVAAYAKLDGSYLKFRGLIASIDGSNIIHIEESIQLGNYGQSDDVLYLATRATKAALEQGAAQILAQVQNETPS